jgi:hypothetical protein
VGVSEAKKHERRDAAGRLTSDAQCDKTLRQLDERATPCCTGVAAQEVDTQQLGCLHREIQPYRRRTTVHAF